jgi:hypothetical protein
MAKKILALVAKNIRVLVAKNKFVHSWQDINSKIHSCICGKT